MRPSERLADVLRPVTLETGVNRYAEGSCLVSFGHTKVLVTASLEEGVPGFLRGKGDNVSLLTMLAPWPWYIGELVLIGLASLAVYYAPFFAIDVLRRPKTSTS